MRDRKGADHIAETVASQRRRRSWPLPDQYRARRHPTKVTHGYQPRDVGALRDAIAKNRDFVVGVKARLSRIGPAPRCRMLSGHRKWTPSTFRYDPYGQTICRCRC